MRPLQLTVALLMLAAPTCSRTQKSPSPAWDDAPRPASLPRAPSVRDAGEAAHPRILLDSVGLARAKRHAAAGSDAWKDVLHECRIYSEKDISSGYLGAEWVRAIFNLSMCWRVTGERDYHDKAFRYLGGLLDDKRQIGDGEGGDEVVHGNSGYPIRNFARGVAIAYDWLYDAPGMNSELRKKMVNRLDAWLSWYKSDGYLADNPFANYFWGYFTSLSLAGLVVDGDDPRADVWERDAETLLEEKVIPGFYKYLKGGDWAEGWQYGQLVSMEAAMLFQSYLRATGKDLTKSWPWLGELVKSRLHSRHPDGKYEYGSGTQLQRPPPPRPLALYAALVFLEHSDPDEAARARYLIHDLYPALEKDHAWFAVLADEPAGEPRKDPREDAPLSYLVEGTGTSFSRSSWAEDATWVSMVLGPRVSIDHQHQDQGHFEIWHGADPVFIDAGSEHASATVHHNTILVDDGGKILPYSPNQGVWGKEVATLAFGDDGQVVVHRGDLRDAWSPKCVKDGCRDHEVAAALRTLVFVRPDIVVTNDDLRVESAGTVVSWIGNVLALPKVSGRHVSSVYQDSRMDLDVLEPRKGALEVTKVPMDKGEETHPYRFYMTKFDAWRIRVEAKRADARRLRVWMHVDDKGARSTAAVPVQGRGLSGGLGYSGRRRVAVLFADDEAGGFARLPMAGADLAVVAGLKTGQAYSLTAEKKSGACVLSVAVLSVASGGEGSGGRVAGEGGFLRVALPGCGLAAAE